MYVTSLCLSVLLMAHLTSSYPTGTGLTGAGLTGTELAPALELQNLLDRLESLLDQGAVPVPRGEEVSAPQEKEEEEVALIRELLAPQNLMPVRNNAPAPPQRSSGCFGRRMDRIGSMSSLGCNTVGKNSPKFS